MNEKDLITCALEAIDFVRDEIRWKPGKDIEHLKRRTKKRHLPKNATLQDYEAIIRKVVNEPTAQIFIYDWFGTPYPTVVAKVGNQLWLTMVNTGGVIETAFVVDRDEYLEGNDYTLLGVLQELEQ